MNFSSTTRRLILIAVLLLWCFALILFRIERTRSYWSAFLLWNLLLAIIPLPAGAALDLNKPRRYVLPQAMCFGVRLLFLPNAPYILTDLIHLKTTPSVPLWYDLALLLSCAGAGLFFCYLSLLDVHRKFEARFGKTAGWLVAFGSLLLCGFGIYLGRFLRWNSWDILTNPRGLFSSVIELISQSSTYPSALAVTMVFGIGLSLGYLALRVAAPIAHSAEHETPTV